MVELLLISCKLNSIVRLTTCVTQFPGLFSTFPDRSDFALRFPGKATFKMKFPGSKSCMSIYATEAKFNFSLGEIFSNLYRASVCDMRIFFHHKICFTTIKIIANYKTKTKGPTSQTSMLPINIIACRFWRCQTLMLLLPSSVQAPVPAGLS